MSLLYPHDPDWAVSFESECARWTAKVPGVLAVHHIGSTSVPGLPAKPTLDIMPVFSDDAARTAARPVVEDMGYEWMGPHGLEGRSYARLFDTDTGARRVHAHGYSKAHPDILRHLAFREVLRQNAPLRAAYTSVKAACAARHPDGGPGYETCKSAWIEKTEAIALERMK